MYPVYSLEIYNYTQHIWIPSTNDEASSRPHHYDVLRKSFDRYVKEAKEAQTPLGYRIMADNRLVDIWTNFKTVNA